MESESEIARFIRKQKAFHENPHINPDTNGRLVRDMKPYKAFVALYGEPPLKSAPSLTLNIVTTDDHPPQFGLGEAKIFPFSIPKLTPELRWNDKHKSEWIEKLFSVEKSSLVVCENLPKVKIPGSPVMKYTSIDGKVSWNNYHYIATKHDIMTPNENLYDFINDSYLRLDKK